MDDPYRRAVRVAARNYDPAALKRRNCAEGRCKALDCPRCRPAQKPIPEHQERHRGRHRPTQADTIREAITTWQQTRTTK